MSTLIHPPAEVPADPSMLLTKADLAEHLRISERQVDNLRSQLPDPIYLGSSPRWRRSEIAAWLSEQSQTARAR